MPVQRGPADLRETYPHTVREEVPARLPGYGTFDIEILAEINHAPRKTLAGTSSRSPAGYAARAGPK